MAEAQYQYKSLLKKTDKFNWPKEAVFPDSIKVEDESQVKGNTSHYSCHDSEQFIEGPILRLLFNELKNMGNQPYEQNLAVVAIISKLAILPHPYLNEILLSTEIPVAPGARTLWTVLQEVSKKLMTMLPKIENFSEKIRVTANRLLTNPPLLKETVEKKSDENTEDENVLEGLIVIEEFCKELAAIAFIKYHHSTE